MARSYSQKGLLGLRFQREGVHHNEGGLAGGASSWLIAFHHLGSKQGYKLWKPGDPMGVPSSSASPWKLPNLPGLPHQPRTDVQIQEPLEDISHSNHQGGKERPFTSF